MQKLRVELNGDEVRASRAEPVPLSLLNRVAIIVQGSWGTQSAVTGNFRDSYEVAAAQFPLLLGELTSIAEDLAEVESELESKGAPWTPSRIPEWSLE